MENTEIKDDKVVMKKIKPKRSDLRRVNIKINYGRVDDYVTMDLGEFRDDTPEVVNQYVINYVKTYGTDNNNAGYFKNNCKNISMCEVVDIKPLPPRMSKAAKIWTAGLLIGGGVVTGIGFLSASFTTVGNNEVALFRNKVTGKLDYSAQHGTFTVSPFAEKLAMSTTVQSHEFGSEDPSKDLSGYIPFNDTAGNEFNAAVLIQWSADNTDLHVAIEKLYKTTGNTDMNASQIIATFRSLIAKTLQTYIDKNTIQPTEVLSKKGTMSNELETELSTNPEILKYGVKINQIIVKDIVAPEDVLTKIKVVSEQQTQKQINDAKVIAADSQKTLLAKQQELAGQQAINDLLNNNFISGALISAGLDITKTVTIQDIQSKLQGIGTTLTDLIKLSKYYDKWDGKLPLSIGDKDALNMLIPTTKP